MKRISISAMFLLIWISALGQERVQVNEKMFVGFQREDGVFVMYEAKGLVTIREGKFAERLETTELKLGKFLAITDQYNTLDEARAKLGLPSITEPEKVEPVQETTKSNDWSKGQVGDRYGSKYDNYVNEINGGTANFKFYGQDVAYPKYNSKDESSELSKIELPTHSIINYAGTDFVSKIEMKLYDEIGREVWHLYDTRGGYHPCITGDDCNSNLRSNNHPDDARRWVKNGNYKLWVKNISSDKRAVQRIDFYVGGNVLILAEMEPGTEQSFDLYIKKLEHGEYKINCNVFTSLR